MSARIGFPCAVCTSHKQNGFYCAHIKNDFTAEESATVAIEGFRGLITHHPQDEDISVISMFDTLENAQNARKVFEEKAPAPWKPLNVIDDTKVVFTVQGRTQLCTWTIQIDELTQ